ncbi:ALF repeat-containing protein [Streptomyces tirandamycinicus]|uniref:ALF repeat-containing protein n=1 Tax=Streptomyces tirandamycinicus TaxID=2174846 RepID=UPI001ABF7EE3|nr:ALF repeat-containing protein [Streptomyces tirandamycinicus]
MQTTFWSRRRVLGALAATTAVASTPSVLLAPVAAAVEGTAPDPVPLPDTERAKVVKAWISGGRGVKSAAAHALFGSDSEIQTFLAETLPNQTVQDNRVALVSSLDRAGKGLRREAVAALDNGDAAIADFLRGGFKPAILEDLQVATTIVSGTGDRAVRRAATAALTAGTEQSLIAFLTDTQYDARLEDTRVQVATMLTQAGPEVQKYADRALSGSASDVEWFVETGQHIARARDQESATIEELVAVVQREGKRAERETNLAVEASARAQTAADKAKEAAEKAAAEAAAAQQDVQKSGAAARKAAGAAKGAADAARNAINASNAAVSASRRASWAATGAAQAAANAGSAAARAFHAAIGASKDAGKAEAAKNAAVAARNAAAKARTAAKAADQAAVAGTKAAAAGSAAASAARNAAAAANAAAQAGAAAGAAQSEAAEAKRQAAIASSAANRATSAASAAHTLATTAAAAARTARDAANAAADHADKAAAAAEEAVKYAGQAVDYANRSTAHAAAAMLAANTATKAVSDALLVEQNARKAEAETLEQDKLQAIDEVRLLAEIETKEMTAYQNKIAQAQQTDQATKDLITKAEQALAANDMGLAAVQGRKAAVALLNSRGAWTRQAAQFALSGTDDDLYAWIDLDRHLAQVQDDRETTLHVATIAGPKIAKAAQAALESPDSKAVGDFLTGGMKRASDEDNRVAIIRILDSNPDGKAVTEAANKALDLNTTESLQNFFDHDYPEAIREDDAVRTVTLMKTGGAFTKAYAEVAMEGPTWMRRNFVSLVQYRTAQLDHDTATHVAAIRGAIAAAAKVAEKAQENAALASKAAADARSAAAEAREWAAKALDSAAKAEDYAAEARRNADAADKSAAAAKASADKASAAASTARSAARSANYSANKAMDSARSALKSSYSAQASAASARASSIAAGKDAATAAAAATEARRIAAAKREAEVRAAAKAAAEKALREREAKIDPADKETNDQINPNGTSADADEWWNDAGFYADAFNAISVGAGFLAAGCALAAFVFPPAAAAAGFFAAVSMGASGLGTLFTGIEYGFTSSEFIDSAIGTGLSLVTFGQSKWIGAADKGLGGKLIKPVVGKIADVGEDVVSGATKVLSTIF